MKARHILVGLALVSLPAWGAAKYLNTIIAPNTGGGRYLDETGAWSVPGGGPGGVSDGDKGDITVSGSGATWNIDANTITATEIADDSVSNAKLQNASVTLAKMDNLAQNRVIGRASSGTGVPEALTATQVLDFLGSTRGDILVRGASGWQVLGVGGGTDVLRSDGIDPYWGSVPGGGAAGTATVDFGAFPGSADASVAVTGQSSIVLGSVVHVDVRPEATADHTADEHMVLPIRCYARDIVAATGFTVHCFYDAPQGSERTPQNGFAPARAGLGGGPDARNRSDQQPRVRDDEESNTNRIHGQFTVGWSWR